MAGRKLAYDVYTENLIEITAVYAGMVAEYPELTEIDSSTWKQQFVVLANEFEETYPETEHWEDSDYFECINSFVKEKILEFAGIEQRQVSERFSETQAKKLFDALLSVCLNFAGAQYTERVLRSEGFGDSELERLGFEIDGEWSDMDPCQEI